MGTKISALSAAGALSGTESVPVVQSGATKKATAQAIANLAPGSTVRGNLGYAQVTADQGSITTVETDLTSLTVTVTTNASERIKITAHVRIKSTVSGDVAELKIKESTTVLALDRVYLGGGTSALRTLHAEVVLTPTAASHTYKLSLVRDEGSGTLSLAAGATFPAFIMVEGVGT